MGCRAPSPRAMWALLTRLVFRSQLLTWICEQLVQSWTPPTHLLQPPRGDHGDTSAEVPLDHGMLNLAKMAEFQQPEEPQALGDHRAL